MDFSGAIIMHFQLDINMLLERVKEEGIAGVGVTAQPVAG
jgi:hypothetical protein